MDHWYAESNNLLRELSTMKKINILIGIVIFFSSSAIYANQEFHVDVSARQYGKIALLLGVVGSESEELDEFADIVKKDFEFSGQFDVSIKFFQSLKAKRDVKELADQGYALAVFINEKGHKAFEWRIYDVAQGAMLQGKKYIKRGDELRGWAHNCADMLWPVLTGQSGFFSTKIAYCKDIKVRGKKHINNVYIADYDGSNEQLLVANPTVNVAPRWNRDMRNPLLFYSEYTNANVRLMAVTMEKRKKITSNFDGVNMVPSFSQDGKKVVYCASRGDGSCHLYHYENGVLKRLTHNRGNNVSPTISEDGN